MGIKSIINKVKGKRKVFKRLCKEREKRVKKRKSEK